MTDPTSMSTQPGNAPARILVVDDDAGVRQFVHDVLERAGYRIDAEESVLAAEERIAGTDYDVVITDIMMPGLTGIDLLRILHQKAPDVPVIVITANPNGETAAEAIRTASAVDYIGKPFTPRELLAVVERAAGIKRMRDGNRRLAAENENYRLHLEEMVKQKSEDLIKAHEGIRISYEFTLEALVAMVDARERATGRHSVRVRDLALILSRAMHLPPSELENIARGTLLHDIGKISIPDAVLLKPGSLTPEEWAIMRSHVRSGYEIVRSSEVFAPAAELILSHHEKYDGSGYPRGLKGDEICLGARIFAVVDAYDAMRSVRVYKPSIPEDKAMEEILRCSGTHFDPGIVDVFGKCLPELERVGGWEP